ncbi:MAG: lysine 2,3-aminomutase [Deferribacteres bacterium]|nr:lysine 2,3-aminomutase [candidate division KSB1 bacterium]MCB9502191.1 lysine 2,3-aminomutase [Deferribacteres bacterium]
MQYKAYSLHNFRKIPQMCDLPEKLKFEIEVVAQVFPFKTNTYVINELINWHNIPNDPIFRLTFPQKEMLLPHHYDKISKLLTLGAEKEVIDKVVDEIHEELNPHPAGQMEHNVPLLEDERLSGLQHKYRETVLFFPSKGQTCHAYCSFCFRWPQFTGKDEYKFAMRETSLLIEYLKRHPEVSDVLVTGGDPMIMNSRSLRHYLEPLIHADLPSLQTIRIGTKSLGFWPYKYLHSLESEEVLSLFRKIVDSGKHLAIMAHFTHPRELSTPAVRAAIKRIRSTGAVIRTQSPVLRHINDDPDIWARMWKLQVKLGCVPYYMFVVRNTGAQHYYGLSLERTYEIYQEAIQQVSGLARTVRGPSMSAMPGKVHITGLFDIKGEKVFGLNMLQARRPDIVMQPFFAKYNPEATWLDELKPAFGEKKFPFE